MRISPRASTGDEGVLELVRVPTRSDTFRQVPTRSGGTDLDENPPPLVPVCLPRMMYMY